MSAKRASFIGVAGPLPRMPSRLLRRFETVTHAADGGNLHPARVELLAKTVHMHLERIGAYLVAPVAQMVDELILGDEATGPLQEKLEQADLARGQFEPPAGERCDTPDLIEAQWSVLDE